MSNQAMFSPEANPRTIMQAAFGFATTQAMVSAIELDLFTHIDEGRRTVLELAQAIGGAERGVRILLNALTAIGMLTKQEDRYALTETARVYLSRKGPRYMGAVVLHMREIERNWMELTGVVRTGRPPVDVEGEQDRGEFFARFVEGLYGLNVEAAETAAREMLKHVPRGGPVRVLDVGAGSGVWGFAFARLDPNVQVTVADWPSVVDGVTKRIAEREGISARVNYLPGSLRETDFGEARYDVVTVGHVCHSEGERHSRELLAKVRRALKPGGQLLIVDWPADEQRAEATFPLLFAVNMLVHTEEGDTFTVAQYRQWLDEAGFEDVNVREAASASMIIARSRAVKEKAA